MAKATATKTKASSAQPEHENVVVESASVPTEKKVKKVKAPKEVVSAPVETTPVVAESTSVPSEQAVEVENSIAEKALEFTAKLQQAGNLLASLKPEFKNIEKMFLRLLKASQKLNTKRKRKSGNRAPSGFVKPTRISDELASFLGKDKGTEMARTSVTKEINAYIRANGLQDTTNGRKINPDTKLSSFLKLKKDDQLTYFNLQKFMCHHFAKSVKPEATA